MLVDYQKVNIYQDERLILKDGYVEVNEGQFIYIIGKVGSGNSSLLKTMYCELDIDREDAKKASILDVDITDLKRSHVPELRKQMGIIFQDFQLLHDRTVALNLKFVLGATGWTDREKINRRIEEVLARVGMLEKKDKMPSELSGGEQQRIAIARALLNNPKVIIADEPTGNLDPETATSIVQLLQDTCKNNTTVIMSTHNIQMIEKFPGTTYKCVNGMFKRENEEEIKAEAKSEIIETTAEVIKAESEEVEAENRIAEAEEA